VKDQLAQLAKRFDGASTSCTAGGSEASTGPILAIHARIEQLAAAAETLAAADETDSVLEARDAVRAESEALRSALLHQSPENWREALVLAHHLVEAASARNTARGPSARVVPTAAEALFDFLAAHVDEDHEPLGETFQKATVRAFYRRRYRTGLLDR